MSDATPHRPERRGSSGGAVPFVSGGFPRLAFDRTARASWLALGAVLAVALLPVRGLYYATGSSMEEGFMLVFPRLVQQGKMPNVDFLHLYGPTSLDALALWYRVLGDSLGSERTFGLLQNVAVVLAIYALARSAGHVAATGAGMAAAVLIMTPIGLSALAWHGGLALALWALVFAGRARSVAPPSAAVSWWLTGGLAGLALGYRPDMVIATALALGWATWGYRDGRRWVLAGALVGLAPLWWHLVDAGPRAALEGMVLEPVFDLRPGRELPRPPSWGIVDGALQAVAEGVPPTWPLPAPAASQQLFVWFVAVVVIALALPVLLHRARQAHPALFAGALFGLGILPQALQRPDSTHLAWVAVVSWPLLIAATASWGGQTGGPSLRRSLSAVATVGALMLVVCPFYTYRHHLLHTRVSLGDLPPPFLVERDGRKFWFGDGSVARALNALVPDLAARSEPGDRLIVGPADLSRTIYSDVSIYYLFPELEPGTRFIEMDPGLADRAGSGLAAEIARADFLVLTNIWTGWHEPNASDDHQSDEHNQAVADHFCLAQRYEDNLVLLYERCEGGGGQSPADVDGTYPRPADD